MKKIYASILLILLSCAWVQAQDLELTFTAVENQEPVVLDSVLIMNRTQGTTTTVFGPEPVASVSIDPGDLMLYVGYITKTEVGIETIPGQQHFGVFDNYPNPADRESFVSFSIPEEGTVQMNAYDLQGRVVATSTLQLGSGIHTLRFLHGESSLYLLTLRWKDQLESVKVINTGTHPENSSRIEYLGFENNGQTYKESAAVADTVLQSGILDTPIEGRGYTFQFATNIACPGTSTVDYEGQTYSTVQVFSQCWLAENLNVGTMINGSEEMTDNGILEKYCYFNDEDNCDTYGGLYLWDEVMQYATQEGTRGICPPGWHLPSDEEWKVLEGAADSQYGIGDPAWDPYEYRGLDVGTNLKSADSWNGTDDFMFNGLPAGLRNGNGGWGSIANFSGWWSSSMTNANYNKSRYFETGETGSGRFDVFELTGFSVRCIRDEGYFYDMKLTFSAIGNMAPVETDSIRVMNRTTGEEAVIYGTEVLLPNHLPFTEGDELLFIGYHDGLESGFLDSPLENREYTFQFAYNIPCPGMETVDYEGQTYNTVQVFSQCWFKENLNVGTMIPGGDDMTDNGTIEKYSYNDNIHDCDTFGGLYQWNELMQYTIQQGTQGICPPGWHIPTDEERKVLNGAVDSQFGIGDPEWDLLMAICGLDAGTALKSTSGWSGNGNGLDLFGFNALPGGSVFEDGSFNFLGEHSYWPSSTENGPASSIGFGVNSSFTGVGRATDPKGAAGSVRCLRDEAYFYNTKLTFSAVNNTSTILTDSIRVMNRTNDTETMLYGDESTLLLPAEMPFSPGDQLLCIGYSDTLQSGILDIPEGSENYTFQFAYDIPCPGTPTVDYEGQTYNTVQVFSQCWLKENLNVGTMIPGGDDMTDNGSIEKWCYGNNEDNCDENGALYQWHEMMQYVTEESVQGICPPGWHIPTDEEYKVLEGAADSQFGIGDPEWEIFGIPRGLDNGTNLKAESGWASTGNGTDLFGFSSLPGGVFNEFGNFGGLGLNGIWWTSTVHNPYTAYVHGLQWNSPGSTRVGLGFMEGYSLRCLRDE